MGIASSELTLAESLAYRPWGAFCDTLVEGTAVEGPAVEGPAKGLCILCNGQASDRLFFLYIILDEF